MKALRRRYGRSESERLLSVAEVERLAVGSLLWWDGRAWVVVPGGLAPTAILPERAGTFTPDGEAVASFGGPFTLIAEGSGKVPTRETAQRKVTAWWEGRRHGHARARAPEKRHDLSFAGYNFTAGPGGTTIHRETIRTDAPGDYGADPIGDGTFRMVPSGDIVDFEERNRRLARKR